ncbi:DUF4355 domain-containing protein [Shouchella clausii]|jgi:HD superfamily phosphohydrolase|uniref:DUF4355 domain-containing protein n=1 Tax=Shouchella clausii TaxID=79880 RepID=UPI000BA76FA7|nr:DUF4355 domain-containing protein [Shouchella clausii]PAD17402.1 hypothetical protein CHH74_01895 [Shouchella clausii]PAE84968.1 hypothetical protein CHH77_02295 [Shouchella clausii]
MTLEEVKQFLAENKEKEDVKAYLEELSAVSADKVKGFLDTDEGKRLLQPRLDQHFTKGLESWKKNNLQSLIDEAVKAANPEETPEQKRIRELEEKLQASEKAAARKELVNKALGIADEKKLPKGIVDFFVADDEETTLSNLSKFEEVYNAAIQEKVEAEFKKAGREVDSGSAAAGDSSYGKLLAEQQTADEDLAAARDSYFK